MFDWNHKVRQQYTKEQRLFFVLGTQPASQPVSHTWTYGNDYWFKWSIPLEFVLRFVSFGCAWYCIMVLALVFFFIGFTCWTAVCGFAIAEELFELVQVENVLFREKKKNNRQITGLFCIQQHPASIRIFCHKGEKDILIHPIGAYITAIIW